MKHYLFIAALFFSSIMMAQNSSEAIVGYDYQSNLSIRGKVYHLGSRVMGFCQDTIGKRVFLKLRETSKNGKWLNNQGEVRAFSVANGLRPLWKKDVNYGLSSVSFEAAGLMIGDGRKTVFYDYSTGIESWRMKGPVLFATKRIALGYKLNLMSPSIKLYAFDLITGEQLWDRKMEYRYGWNSISYQNDSTILVAADGLNQIRLSDGKGWVQPLKMGTTDYKAAAAIGALGVLSAVFTGVGVMPLGGNLVTGLCSNTLLEDGLIYQADRYGLNCYNSTGFQLWHAEFPDKMGGSKSELLCDSTRLFLINRGYGRMGARLVNIGRPFIACYDKKSGERIFFSPLSSEKKDQVEDIQFAYGTFYMLFDNGMTSRSMNDTASIHIIPWDVKQYGKVKRFVSRDFYMANQDSTIFHRIHMPDPDRCLLVGERALFEVDNSLHVLREIPYSQVYFPIDSWGDNTIIRKGNVSYMINALGQRMASFNFGQEIFVYDNRLYGIKEGDMYMVELGDNDNVESGNRGN